MRIMYINDTGFDSPNSNNHLVLSMLTNFMAANHSVYYVGSHSVGLFPDIPEELRSFDIFDFDIIEKPIIERKNLVKRYLTAIAYERRARRKWKKKIKEVDIVIVQSHYTAYFTFKMLSKYKKKTIFNIYDIFPGATFESSGMHSKMVYKVFATLQKYIYKHANRIFTLTNDTRSTLLSIGVDGKKISIIPNWFDDSKVKKTNCDAFMQEFNLSKTKKYVQYAGQIGMSYDFYFLLDIADSLRKREDIVFELVGEGLYLDELKSIVAEKKLSNVIFIPWQPLERLSEVYSSCILQVVPLKRGIIYNSYPSKILPLMGCSKTAIVSVDEDSYFYREMNKNKIVYCVPLNDVEAFKNAVIKMCDDDDLRKNYEKNAYAFATTNYTAKINTDKMLSIFKDMLEE